MSVYQDEINKLSLSQNVKERLEAVSALKDKFRLLPDKFVAWSDLHRLINDENQEVRSSAASALGSAFAHIPDKSAAWDDLHRLTNDENQNVRRSAAYAFRFAFEHFPEKSTAWDDLHRLITDENQNVRRSAVKALDIAFAHIPNKSAAWDDLHKLTNDENQAVRSSAAYTLGSAFAHVPDRTIAWDDLHRLTNDKNQNVRKNVAYAVRFVFSSVYDEFKYQSLTDLIKFTDDENSDIRKYALSVLSSLFNQDFDSSNMQDLLYKLKNDKSIHFNANASEFKKIYSNLPIDNSEIPIDSQKTAINSEASIHKANATDQPSIKDFLGFEPYVQAIYEFLKTPATKPPLTLSIEGPWGIGKSSFMSQLKHKFDKDGALTVEFNPWRHDKENAVWASFTIEFINQLSEKLNFWQKFKIYGILLRLRFKWGSKNFNRLTFISLTISILIIFYLHLILESTWLAILAPIPVLMAGALKFRENILNPLASDLNKCFSSPNYEQYVAFIEHFHNDFKNIVDAYTTNKDKDEKIYVFIDDLDRCEIPTAANLLQALNLMIASNPRIIFIIGLDRMKVAAGLAVKYETILPYLNSQPDAIQMKDEFSKKSIKGLEFGYEFIEKFIQVPFSVPQPDEINIKKLIEEMTPEEEDETNDLHSFVSSNIIERILSKFSPKTDTSKTPDDISAEVKEDLDAIDAEVKKELDEIKLEVTRDSETIREIALMVSPALDNNPRRMKQFINLFRLRVFIATNTGLLGEGKYLTLEQLGKFVAITLKWPLLIANLEDKPDLLNELQIIANGDDENSDDFSQNTKHWHSDLKLIALLKYGCDTESSRYSLENLDVMGLLKVSSKVDN